MTSPGNNMRELADAGRLILSSASVLHNAASAGGRHYLRIICGAGSITVQP
jgi:hypothetical protein